MFSFSAQIVRDRPKLPKNSRYGVEKISKPIRIVLTATAGNARFLSRTNSWGVCFSLFFPKKCRQHQTKPKRAPLISAGSCCCPWIFFWRVIICFLFVNHLGELGGLRVRVWPGNFRLRFRVQLGLRKRLGSIVGRLGAA